MPPSLNVLCYYNAQINQQQPGSTDHKTDIIKWKSRSVLKNHFIHRIDQSILLHLITYKLTLLKHWTFGLFTVGASASDTKHNNNNNNNTLWLNIY
jgi:hypothetical protein